MKRTLLAAAFALGAAVCLLARPSIASPGAECSHTYQCSKGLWCLADAPTSTSGHCARLPILYP